MDLKATYNKIAKDWATDHRTDTWWLEGTDTYASFFQPRASILDVGCGSGEKANYLIQRGLDVTGIDFSEEMVALAKERVPGGRFLVRDIHYPLELAGSFDGVFAQAVLLHIPKREVANVLKNIIAPLKQGGYFYAAVKEIRPGGKEEEVMKEHDYGYEYARFFSYFTPEELKRYITDRGFKPVYEKVSTSGKTNWIQVIAQKA